MEYDVCGSRKSIALIVGSDEIMGCELAAQLIASDRRVVWRIDDSCHEQDRLRLEELTWERTRECLQEQCAGLEARSLPAHVAAGDDELKRSTAQAITDGARLDAIWVIGEDAAEDGARLVRLLDALRLLTPTDSSTVVSLITPLSAVELLRDVVAGWCAERVLPYCVFATVPVVGHRFIRDHRSGTSVLGLLQPFGEVIAEIRERMPDYFDYHALRLLVPPGSTMNLVDVQYAVESMLAVAGRPEALCAEHRIEPSENVSADVFFEILGDLYDVSIVTVDDPGALAPVDRLLRESLHGAETLFCTPGRLEPTDDEALSDDPSRNDSLRTTCSAIHRRLDVLRLERLERAGRLPERFRRRTLTRGPSELKYFVAGDRGTPLLVLNAIGQGLQYWYRLMERLIHRYRFVIWETRGLASDTPRMNLDDQVEDVRRVLEAERYERCVLVGWCTGPQVAAEFFLRYPQQVAGMVFLNSAFKIAGRPDLESAYQLGLDALCGMVHAKPELAPSVMRSLAVVPDADIDLTDPDVGPGEVLRLVNVDLRTEVLAAFRTADMTLRYAQQIVDLTSREVLDRADRIRVPVLVVGCEFDKVASPLKSREIAACLPVATHVELPGATHYSIYDRPRVVADLLEQFIGALAINDDRAPANHCA